MSRFSRFVLCALMASGWMPSLLAQNKIVEYPLISRSGLNTSPQTIVYASNAFWFAEFSANAIGYINIPTAAANAVTNYEIFLPTPNANPFGMVAYPAVNPTDIWFTEASANKIGYLHLADKSIHEFPLTDGNSRPGTIIIGPDTNLYFAEYNYNRIAGFDPANTIATTNLTLTFASQSILSSSQIYGLTVGPDNTIWVAVATWGQIVNLDVLSYATNSSLTNLITTNQLPISTSVPLNIVKGPDNALWFTEYSSDRIGRFVTSTVYTNAPTNGVLALQEFPVPKLPGYGTAQPYDIIVGNDGNLWFTEFTGSCIGRITTNGIITIFPTPTPASYPSFIATGDAASGLGTNIWFGENDQNYIYYHNNNLGMLPTANALSLQTVTQTSLSLTTNFTPYVTNLTITFANSTPTNTFSIVWGDGIYNVIGLTNGNFATYNDGLTAIQVTSPDGTNMTVTASHNYPSALNYFIAMNVADPNGNIATATINVAPDAFFSGELLQSSSVNYFLNLPPSAPAGNFFGYYAFNTFPYFYHFDLGYEYFFSGNDSPNDSAKDAYFYDFTSHHFFYTGQTLFPYIYDFSLNSWLYYYSYDVPTNYIPGAVVPLPGHYTSNPRYFYRFPTNNPAFSATNIISE